MTRAGLADIPVDECRDILTRSRWGRLQVVVEGKTTTLAVQHVFDPRTISVVVPVTSVLGWPRSSDYPVVFEVDWIEPAEHGRRTVTVVGPATEVTDPAETARLAALRVDSWVPCEAIRWLRIQAGHTTGRRRSGPSSNRHWPRHLCRAWSRAARPRGL